MAKAVRPSPVKLILGAIFASEGVLIKAEAQLKRKFGPIDFASPIIPFNFTKYYEEEMGLGLLRKFFSFQKLINPNQLATIKSYTNRLEKRLSLKKDNLGRTINLDPGYISLSKLVLATWKNYAHRIYLDKGIFAEIALHFQDESFQPWPWTYPDYKSKAYLQVFKAIRQIYLTQLKP